MLITVLSVWNLIVLLNDVFERLDCKIQEITYSTCKDDVLYAHEDQSCYLFFLYFRKTDRSGSDYSLTLSVVMFAWHQRVKMYRWIRYYCPGTCNSSFPFHKVFIIICLYSKREICINHVPLRLVVTFDINHWSITRKCAHTHTHTHTHIYTLVHKRHKSNSNRLHSLSFRWYKEPRGPQGLSLLNEQAHHLPTFGCFQLLLLIDLHRRQTQ